MPAKTGDVVQLKSGGPKMTVYAVSPSPGGGLWCKWFDGAALQKGEFSAETVRVLPYDDKETT